MVLKDLKIQPIGFSRANIRYFFYCTKLSAWMLANKVVWMKRSTFGWKFIIPTRCPLEMNVVYFPELFVFALSNSECLTFITYSTRKWMHIRIIY
jgi:hypothetical protein